jgi:hypothetical protein
VRTRREQLVDAIARRFAEMQIPRIRTVCKSRSIILHPNDISDLRARDDSGFSLDRLVSSAKPSTSEVRITVTPPERLAA